MNPKIAILIPCYNEALTISKTVAEFKEEFPAADIYVYDNNSTDDSAQLALEAGAIVRHEPRQGKGNVMRSMFREVDADVYLITDADDAFPAATAHEMIELVLSGKADMVTGDRLSTTYHNLNKRPMHSFGNRLIVRLVNTFFGGSVKDIMTGYRAFSPLFVKTFPVLSKGFEIETEMTIHALDKNLHMAEIPVVYRDRPEGSVSKLNTYRDGAKVLMTIFNLFKDYRPLAFFALIAAALTITSAALFIPVLITYLQTSLVPRFPTLIVSGFIMIAAILSFMCGLILDSLKRKDRQDAEFKLNLMQVLLKKQNKEND